MQNNIIKSCLIGFVFLSFLFSSCHNNNDQYKGMPEELVALCKKIDKHPKDAEAYYQRAVYYYDKGIINKGFNDIIKAVKFDDTKAKYYICLSDYYFAQKETDLTEEMLQKAIQLEPDNNEARLKLAELFFHLSMYKECNATLDEAIKRQNYNPKANLIRAFCYKEAGDTVNTVRMLQLVIDQNPKEVKAFLELGYLYQSRLNPLAAEYYKNALQIEPDNIEIRYNLAKLYQDLGQIDEAVEEYRQLLTINPNFIIALNNLGYIYLVDKDEYEESIKYFDKALAIDSTFVNALCNRGVAYESMGEYALAQQNYEAAKRYNANYEPAVLGLNRLDKISHKKQKR